jgi:hypothetical protein
VSGAVSAALEPALRAAFLVRGIVVTPFHIPRRQFPFIAFPRGNLFPGTRRRYLVFFAAVNAFLPRIQGISRQFYPATRAFCHTQPQP